jgi:hypothetical protein
MRGWIDNIKLCVGEIRWGGVDWIVQAQYRGLLRALEITFMDL